jgi:hypothetical protein
VFYDLVFKLFFPVMREAAVCGSSSQTVSKTVTLRTIRRYRTACRSLLAGSYRNWKAPVSFGVCEGPSIYVLFVLSA